MSKKMPKHGMAVHVLLDASGSMNETVDEARDAFNEFMLQMQRITMPPLITLKAFGMGRGGVSTICKDVPAYQVPKLTETNYDACGNTPMFHAMRKSIAELKATDAQHKVMVVLGDGGDNEGMGPADMTQMIEDARRAGWLILFLADEHDGKYNADDGMGNISMPERAARSVGIPIEYIKPFNGNTMGAALAASDAVIKFGDTGKADECRMR